MPIAFMRMKQFEAQGKQLQGVAAGAAAGSVMSSGMTSLMRATGTIISSEPNHHRKVLPMHVLQVEDVKDGYNFPKFDFRGQI